MAEENALWQQCAMHKIDQNAGGVERYTQRSLGGGGGNKGAVSLNIVQIPETAWTWDLIRICRTCSHTYPSLLRSNQFFRLDFHDRNWIKQRIDAYWVSHHLKNEPTTICYREVLLQSIQLLLYTWVIPDYEHSLVSTKEHTKRKPNPTQDGRRTGQENFPITTKHARRKWRYSCRRAEGNPVFWLCWYQFSPLGERHEN